MIFEYSSTENEKFLKSIPQFYGMSIAEIQAFIAKMNEREHAEWLQTFYDKLMRERAQCREYVETKPDYSKPFDATDVVVIEECIKISSDKIDDKGFVSTKDIEKLERNVKLSRSKIPNGKVYISPKKVEKIISTKAPDSSWVRGY